MAANNDNPSWDSSFRLERQSLAFDEQVFGAMDAVVHTEEHLSKAFAACRFLISKVERLEDDKQSLLQRQAEMAKERTDLRSRLTASIAVAAASSSSASTTELEFDHMKRDFAMFRQRSQMEASSRKVELDARQLELKEMELSLSDAQAAAKAAEMKVAEMEKHHRQAFGDLFVLKEELDEEYQLSCRLGRESEEKLGTVMKQLEDERILRSTFETRIIDTALLGIQVRAEIVNISHEMQEELRDLESLQRDQHEKMMRAALEVAETNGVVQRQMLDAVQVISQAQTDIMEFREFTEESQNDALLLSTQALLSEQKLQTMELELTHITSKAECVEARNHVLEHEKSELLQKIDEEVQKQGRAQQVAAEAASRSNEEIAGLLRERQELGAGFDEAIERTTSAEEELGKVKEQTAEMKNHLTQLEQERERTRQETAKRLDEVAQLKEELAIREEMLRTAALESLSLKQDRQLDVMRRGTAESGQASVLTGLLLELQGVQADVKETHAAMATALLHHGQCCEVRAQALAEWHKQRERCARETKELAGRAEGAEKAVTELKRGKETVESERDAASDRAEKAESKLAEAVREVLRLREARAEAEERLRLLAGLVGELNEDVGAAVEAGDTQRDVVSGLVDSTEVRNKDVFLLMVEIDECETKIKAQANELRALKDKEGDAQIEIARIQQDLDSLRQELRAKQRELNLANIATGDAVEQAKTANAKCETALAAGKARSDAATVEAKASLRRAEEQRAEAEECLARERAAASLRGRGQQAQAKELLEMMKSAVSEVEQTCSEMREASEHADRCCEARITCMVEMQGVKDQLEALRVSAERAQSEIQARAVEVCGELGTANSELHAVMAETVELMQDGMAALVRERDMRARAEAQNVQMTSLLEQLHADATQEMEDKPTTATTTAADAGQQTSVVRAQEDTREGESMRAALQAAERRADETRRSILREQSARADVERRLREMAALARVLLSDLNEAMEIHAAVVPSLLAKKQAAADVYMLMAELDDSESKVTEQTNRAAVFQQREAAVRRDMEAMHEDLVGKQKESAQALSAAHEQLAETADDNRDLVARLFVAKQDTFHAARRHQAEALAVSAELDAAEAAVAQLDDLMSLVETVSSTRGGSTMALEEECTALLVLVEESEASKEDLRTRLAEAQEHMVNLQADVASADQRMTTAHQGWDRSRRDLESQVERLQADAASARDDLHRSNMVVVQLESRALKDDGPLAVAARDAGSGVSDRSALGGQMEILRGGLRTVEQRCETLDAEIKESRARERTLWREKQDLSEQLEQKRSEAERLSLDLLTSLKDLDDSRGQVKRMSKQTPTTQSDASLVSRACSDTVTVLEDLVAASHRHTRSLVQKVVMLEGTCSVFKSALGQSEARGMDLQALLTECTSRISVLQNEVSSERRKHDNERIRADAELADAARTLREAQARASAMEAEERMLKEEIAALHANQYAASSRGAEPHKTSQAVNTDPDITKSTVIAAGRGSVRGAEVSWSPIRVDAGVGSDEDDAPGIHARLTVDREWVPSPSATNVSAGSVLGSTQHDASLGPSRGPTRAMAMPTGSEAEGATSRGLSLRGGPQAFWLEESNMRMRVAEEKASRAASRCAELSECVVRLQEECSLLRSNTDGHQQSPRAAAHAESLTADLLTALKNLDEVRSERQALAQKMAEVARENVRLSEELRAADGRHRAEVGGLRTALSHTQQVQARANKVAAELLEQVRSLQAIIGEDGDHSSPNARKVLFPAPLPQPSMVAVPPRLPHASEAPRSSMSPAQNTTPERVVRLEHEKEQLMSKLDGLRSSLQAKDQKLGVLDKCLEMASSRETGVLAEMHALHLDMCGDWQAIAAASARRAGGAELQLLSMIGENKLMSAEASSTDLAKKAGDMRGVYKKVMVEMKRAHSKLISELETSLGSQESREGDLHHAQAEIHQLRQLLASLQAELASSRQAGAALEEQLRSSDLRARALHQEATVAKETALSERGRSHRQAEEAQGLKSRIITLVRKVEQSREEARAARTKATAPPTTMTARPPPIAEQEEQLALREEHLEQLQQELMAVHRSQQELQGAHDSFKQRELAWKSRVAELEQQLSARSAIKTVSAEQSMAATSTADALRRQLQEEQGRRERAEKRGAEEEEMRREAEARALKLEQGKAEAEDEVRGLRARVADREEQRGRSLRVETRKAELEEEVAMLQQRLRDAESMATVLREEAERERAAAASAVRLVEGGKRQTETAKERVRELEGHLQHATNMVSDLQRDLRGLTELLLAVELSVMADSRERAALHSKAKAAAAREDELVVQVQTLRTALHEQSLDTLLEPRVVSVPTATERASSHIGEDRIGAEHAEAAGRSKTRALESQVSELRQRELRWEETAGRYKRELSAVRRELDAALDGVEKLKREKDLLERGRGVREAKLEGEIGLLEQRLQEEKMRRGDKTLELDEFEDGYETRRTPHRVKRDYGSANPTPDYRHRSDQTHKVLGTDRTWGYGASRY